MKRICSLLVLTVMLRVWWNGYRHLGIDHETGSGILLNVGDYRLLHVVRDDGKGFDSIEANRVYKIQWVEVKAERDK